MLRQMAITSCHLVKERHHILYDGRNMFYDKPKLAL